MEPRPIADSVAVVGRQLGLPSPGVLEEVISLWGEVAGRLAVVSEPVSVRNDRLVVLASEPAVAEALEWQGGTICDRLRALIPDLPVAGMDGRTPRRCRLPRGCPGGPIGTPLSGRLRTCQLPPITS
jgi:hypothetical protein